MAFSKSARMEILARDGFTCVECDKSFYPMGTFMEIAGFTVTNPDWNVNAAHLAPRDYRGRDHRAYNYDGSPRGVTLDVLHHAIQEKGITCLKNSLTLLMGQTIRTFYFIEENGFQDADVPLGVGSELGLGRIETIDFNNQRRQAIQEVLIKRFGALVVGGREPTLTTTAIRKSLGGGGRRRV